MVAASDKHLVVIAIEVRQPKGFGRVRMRHISNASAESLAPFVCDVVTPGAVVLTDAWRGYDALPKRRYTRRKTVLSSSGDPAPVSMPGVHRIASLLKRWILGTHQGSIAGAHLQSYLEEFTFRFNRRTSRSRGLCSAGCSSRLSLADLLPKLTSPMATSGKPNDLLRRRS